MAYYALMTTPKLLPIGAHDFPDMMRGPYVYDLKSGFHSGTGIG